MNRNNAGIIGVGTFILGLTFVSFFAALVHAQLEARSGQGFPTSVEESAWTNVTHSAPGRQITT